jgi:hypothetical protein
VWSTRNVTLARRLSFHFDPRALRMQWIPTTNPFVNDSNVAFLMTLAICCSHGGLSPAVAVQFVHHLNLSHTVNQFRRQLLFCTYYAALPLLFTLQDKRG